MNRISDLTRRLWAALLALCLVLALTLPVCWINRAFFLSGWKGIKTRAPGMDTLVALGAGASLAYGVFAIVMICIGLSTAATTWSCSTATTSILSRRP